MNAPFAHSATLLASMRPQPLPRPPQWARDRVDAICGGADMTDDMAWVVYLRLAEYVAAVEQAPESLA